MSQPKHRLHNGQSNAVLRHWQSRANDRFSSGDFVLPLFITNDDTADEPIQSFPGVHRFGIVTAINYLKPLIDKGLQTVLIFASLSKDKNLEDAFDEKLNPALRLPKEFKKVFPTLTLIVDVCLCTYNPTGHCGIFHPSPNGEAVIDNDQSLELLSKLATTFGQAGYDIIAPSDMMDGRIGAIRRALDGACLRHVSIMSYSAKFASNLYGPFRNAAGSAPAFGDRKCYQLPAGSSGLAMRAVARDVEEGAAFVMVKPAMMYLDIVSQISKQYPDYPLAVYHVSGEYSMLYEGAEKGLFNLCDIVRETMTSFKRAGANILITYYTPQILDWIQNGTF